MTIRMQLEFVDDAGRRVFCLKPIDQIDEDTPVNDLYFGRGTVPVVEMGKVVGQAPMPPFPIEAESEREAYENFDKALKTAQDRVKKEFFEQVNKIQVAHDIEMPPINGKRRK